MNTNILGRIFAGVVFIGSVILFITGHSYAAEGSSTATGLSKAFNPSIGANALFLGTYTSNSEKTDDPHSEAFQTGLHIQELELGLMAVVDPFLRAQVTLAMHGVENIEIEEAYVRTTSLPRGLGLEIGKFFLPFGKHNRLHTHSFPFIDGPWINSVLLGHHGLNDVGIELSYLIPLSRFSEAAVVVFDPGEESPVVTANNKNFGYMANWRNLWDITSTTTLEWGISWVGAEASREVLHHLSSPLSHHGEDDEETVHGNAGQNIFGTDITFKHVSPSPKYHSWDISTEYLQELVQYDTNHYAQYGGITAYGRFQVSRRWWVQGRSDVLGLPMQVPSEATEKEVENEDEKQFSNGDTPWKLSCGVALVLSEFTAIRLQYDYIDSIIQNPENRVLLQLNVTFGAHPAHSY